MAKKNQPQTETVQKVQTKYDRKMEARRKQEEKDKRDAKVMHIGVTVVCAVVVAAIVGSLGKTMWDKKVATKDAYVTVGEHAVTKMEFDYYYQAALSGYSAMLPYMGVDLTADLSEQQYTENLSWKDFIDGMAVEQIKQTKAMLDDAAANHFTYDVSEEYANAVSSLKAGAESSGVSLAELYRTAYGKYATEKSMERILKEDLLAAAYYNHLMEQNAPQEEEIKEYYEQNVQSYDKVDYRSFVFSAETEEEASEDEKAKAMAEAKEKAEAMAEARKNGEEFKELCMANASEEEKAAYEDTEEDASLREGATYSGTPFAISDWLYEEGRTEGELTVIEDTSGSRYYVVEFIRRYYDEADDENISNTIASQRTSEYVNNLVAEYAVVDNKGELKYLTVETEEEAAADETEEETAAEEEPSEGNE